MHKPQMITHKYPGRLIFPEGADFAGKTTVARLITEKLKSTGYDVCSTKEPSETTIFGRTVRAIYQPDHNPGKAIGECLDSQEFKDFCQIVPGHAKLPIQEFAFFGHQLCSSDKPNYIRTSSDGQFFLQLGMLFDRYLHYQDVIIPALKYGRVVVSDRCCWSTFAYAKAMGIDWQYLVKAHNEILGDVFIRPDLLILLDVSLEEALRRKAERGGRDLFESKEKIEKSITAYKEQFALGLFPSAIAIDAGRNNPNGIFDEVWSHVERILPNK